MKDINTHSIIVLFIMDNSKNPTTQTSMDNGKDNENQIHITVRYDTDGTDTVRTNTDNQSHNNENESDTITIDGVSYCKDGQCDNCKSCIYESEQEYERIKELSMLYLD